MSFAQTKTQSQRFQIPPVDRTISESSTFVTDLLIVWTVGPTEEIKLRFEISTSATSNQCNR